MAPSPHEGRHFIERLSACKSLPAKTECSNVGCGRTGVRASRRLSEYLTDLRDPARIVHDQQVMLAQRIHGIALGYEDLNDHDTLRSDPLMSLLAGRRPDPAAPLAFSPTLCRRLENRVDRKSLVRMPQVFVETFIASHKRPPREIVLDFDATDDRVHGNPEGRFFHGYYDDSCFLPL